MLNASEEERIFDVLLKHHVPPSSVCVTKGGTPVSDFHELTSGADYEAHLLEGYSLRSIREHVTNDAPGDGWYAKRRLSFGDSGDLRSRIDRLDREGVVEMVEEVVLETIFHYGLVSEGDSVLVGLSGNTDSSSLLLALDAVVEEIPDASLGAVTVAEPWSRGDDYLEHARMLCANSGVDHRVVTADGIEELYSLNTSIGTIFDQLIGTEHESAFSRLIDGIHRRVLERSAEENGFDAISIGSHSSELVAGILNWFTTSLDSIPGGIPERSFDHYTYVYPLAFLSKKELYLYHLAKTDRRPGFTAPNLWERAPDEQSFHYFLSDLLHSYWPGIQYWIIEAHNQFLTNREGELDAVTCDNCGKIHLRQETDWCYPCQVFMDNGYVDNTK